MKTAEDIESYLIRMESDYVLIGENIWLIKDAGPEIVVSINEPVVVFRVKVIDLEKVLAPKREPLFSTLLELNVSEMLHGAYGIEEGAIVMTAALQLANLDFNEFQAAVDDISMAISRHYATLSRIAA